MKVLSKKKYFLLAGVFMGTASITGMSFAAAPTELEPLNLGGDYYMGGAKVSHSNDEVINNITNVTAILNGTDKSGVEGAGLGYKKVGLATSYLGLTRTFSPTGFLSSVILSSAKAKIANDFKIDVGRLDDIVTAYKDNKKLDNPNEESLRQAFMFSDKARTMEVDLTNAFPKVITHVNNMTTAINANTTKLKELDDKANQSDLAALQGIVATHDTDINQLKTTKVDRSELADYAKKTEVSLTNNTGDISKNREAIVQNSQAIRDVDTKVEKTGALVGALAGLRTVAYNPAKPLQIMGAVGYYKGKSAVALGLGHYSSRDVLIHGGFSFADSNSMMANVGVTVNVGPGKSPNAALHDNDTILALEQEIRDLKAEHTKEMKEVNKRLHLLEQLLKQK